MTCSEYTDTKKLIRINDYKFYFHECNENLPKLHARAIDIMNIKPVHYLKISLSNDEDGSTTHELNYERGLVRIIREGRYECDADLENWFSQYFLSLKDLQEYVVDKTIQNLKKTQQK